MAATAAYRYPNRRYTKDDAPAPVTSMVNSCQSAGPPDDWGPVTYPAPAATRTAAPVAHASSRPNRYRRKRPTSNSASPHTATPDARQVAPAASALLTSKLTATSATAAATIRSPKPKRVSRRNRFVRRRPTRRPGAIRACCAGSMSPERSQLRASRSARIVRSCSTLYLLIRSVQAVAREERAPR